MTSTRPCTAVRPVDVGFVGAAVFCEGLLPAVVDEAPSPPARRRGLKRRA